MRARLHDLIRLVASGIALQGAPVVLRRCAPGSGSACGSTSIDLPPAAIQRIVALDSAELAGAWRVRLAPIGDLIAVGRPSPAADRDDRILVLLDVSGSMKGPKIGAARLVVREFLDQLSRIPARSMRVAIAPFGSVNVESRIGAAAFVGVDSARFAIDRLPSPGRENTALYTAVTLGAQRLAAEVGRTNPQSTGLLVVITDGDNDVGRGDDPGLLTGAEGLQSAAATVGASKVWLGVIGIGALDQAALRQLTGSRGSVFSVPAVPSAFDLSEPLSRLRRVLESRWDLQFRLGSSGRADLGRRPGPLAIEVGSGGTWTPVGDGSWRPPFVALPAYAAVAANGIAIDRVVSGGLAAALTFVVPLAFVLLLLMEIWVVVPRVLWPTGVATAAAGPPGPAASPTAAKTAGTVRPAMRVEMRGAPSSAAAPISATSAASAPTVVPASPAPRASAPVPGGPIEAPPRKPVDVTASKARRT